MDRDKYIRAAVRRPSKNGTRGETPGKGGSWVSGEGGKELETADWENYYSLSRSFPPSSSSPSPLLGPRVWAPSDVNCAATASRQYVFEETLGTFERRRLVNATYLHHFRGLSSPTWESNASPSRAKWIELPRCATAISRDDECIACPTNFDGVVIAICMVIFRDYAPPNLRRFANIGSVTHEKLRATKNDAIGSSDSSEVKMLISLFAACVSIFSRDIPRNKFRGVILFSGNAYLHWEKWCPAGTTRVKLARSARLI